MDRTKQEHMTHFLSDMYAVEQQALAQLVSAPKIAGDPVLADVFQQHHDETQSQARAVENRLEAVGGSTSAVKDAIMKLGGKGFLLFAKVQPETPGRLVTHAYSYEAMEWAGYEMLRRFARSAGDGETERVAREIGREEKTMMLRLESHFDTVENQAHHDVAPDDMPHHLRKHLLEAHAFGTQSTKLLKKSEQRAGAGTLQEIYDKLLAVTEQHVGAVERRLEELGESSSGWRDAALAVGGTNWSYFFRAQSDTPAKFAAFVYAVIHLEIGGYELLRRTATRASDEQTAALCERVLHENRAVSESTTAWFDAAVETTLRAVEAAGS